MAAPDDSSPPRQSIVQAGQHSAVVRSPLALRIAPKSSCSASTHFEGPTNFLIALSLTPRR
jgi:hypothetical protein